MGVSERREREREQRRQDIVAAARRVFFSKGFEAATMEDVAAAAELGKATLYLYFESKEDVYCAVMALGMRLLLDAFEGAVAGRDCGYDQTEAIGRAYVAFARSEADYFHAMMHFEAAAPPAEPTPAMIACEDLQRRTIAAVADAIQRGLDDGSIRPALDPLRVALLLWAQTTGVLQVAAVKGEAIEAQHGITPDDLVESFFGFIARALRPEPGAGPGGRGTS